MRKMSGQIFLAMLFALAISHSRAPGEDDATKRELVKFQGEGKMVSGVADGFAMPDQTADRFKRICKGDEVTTTNGQQVVMKAKITLDPAKSPKTIDYQVIEGPTKGKTHLGIYEFDGDTFKSCFGAPDEPRPTDFASKQGDRRTFSIWKRSSAGSKNEEKK